jgi:hypothetical protein
MANVDWSKLTFSYTKTNTILTTTFRNGEWSPAESHTDDYMKVSAYCGAFHYAIECFEGLKAFRGKDGKVRLFRPEENALRLRRSAEYLGIEAPSVEMFVELCKRAIREKSLLYEGLKHYFIVEFPQKSGAVVSFINNVIGPSDDLVHIQYIKKTNKNFGPALIGIELAAKDHFDSLIERMKAHGIKYKYINDNNLLFEILI